MAGVNRVTILGNLGRDPEMRYLPSGSPVTNFSVAVSRRWKDKATDQYREETEWFNVACFDRLAEIANEYLAKGKQVYIEGRLKTTVSEKNGEKKYFTQVVANELQMIGKKDDSEGDQSESESRGDFQFPF